MAQPATPLVVVHPGFHKTGTTSVQHTLAHNAQLLAPHVDVALQAQTRQIGRAARQYSAQPTQLHLSRFAFAVADFLDGRDRADDRPLLLSDEDFCGHLPGRKGLMDYGAAQALMAQMAEVIQAHFGAGTKLHLHFTTRAPEAWLRSLWWQNLKALRLTEDLVAYSARMRDAADLDWIVSSVRSAVQAEVSAARLEQSKDDALGPLRHLLELAGVPGAVIAKVKPLPQKNRQPEGAAAHLLALNRGEMDNAALKAAKAAYMQNLRAKGLLRGKAEGAA